MNVIFKSSSGSIFAAVNSWQAANEAARAIFKRKYWSDIYYNLTLDNGDNVTGSIDLEPATFHTGHQRQIFTKHLRTFWGNLSKLQPGQYGITSAEIKFFKSSLQQIPE